MAKFTTSKSNQPDRAPDVPFDQKYSPKAPKELSDCAKQAFEELVSILKEERRLFRRDYPVILQYAQAQGRFLEITERMNEPGYKYYMRRPNDFLVAPDHRLAAEAARQARTILTEYFLFGHRRGTVSGTDAGGNQSAPVRTAEHDEDDWVLGTGKREFELTAAVR